MAINQRITLVLGACVVLLMSVGYTSRISRSRDQATAKALTNTQTETAGCSKIMARNLCKDYRNYVIEGLSDMLQADLTCISDLCNTKNVDKCCKTIKDLTNALTGQSPDTLHIEKDSFNRLTALTGGQVASVEVTHANSAKGKVYVEKKVAPPPKAQVESKMPGPKPWASKLGWDLDASGKFHYSSGGQKADPSVVPEGCHEYAHVDFCFSPKQGDSWVLGKARNMEQNELQCVGYLCNHFNNEKCCGSLLGIKAAINGKNWYDLAEREENFDRLLRATGEYLA